MLEEALYAAAAVISMREKYCPCSLHWYVCVSELRRYVMQLDQSPLDGDYTHQ